MIRKVLVMFTVLFLFEVSWLSAQISSDEVVFLNNSRFKFIHVMVKSDSGEVKYFTIPSNGKKVIKRKTINKMKEKILYVASTHVDINKFPMYFGRDIEFPATIDFGAIPICYDLEFVEGDKLSAKFVGCTNIDSGNCKIVECKIINDWDDPTSTPKTRRICVQWATGHWPWCDWWKECTGHKYECKKLRNQLILVVKVCKPGITFEQLRKKINECKDKGSVAAAFAAMTSALFDPTSSFEAAKNAFITVFSACITSSISPIEVRVEIRSHWTSWGPC